MNIPPGEISRRFSRRMREAIKSILVSFVASDK